MAISAIRVAAEPEGKLGLGVANDVVLLLQDSWDKKLTVHPPLYGKSHDEQTTSFMYLVPPGHGSGA